MLIRFDSFIMFVVSQWHCCFSFIFVACFLSSFRLFIIYFFDVFIFSMLALIDLRDSKWTQNAFISHENDQIFMNVHQNERLLFMFFFFIFVMIENYIWLQFFFFVCSIRQRIDSGWTKPVSADKIVEGRFYFAVFYSTGKSMLNVHERFYLYLFVFFLLLISSIAYIVIVL